MNASSASKSSSSFWPRNHETKYRAGPTPAAVAGSASISSAALLRLGVASAMITSWFS